jgi:hypothetical protein
VDPWLTAFRCSRNPAHLLYVEESVTGRLETPENEEIGCLWGDEGVMERLSGEFEVTVTGKIRDGVLTAPIPPAA